MERNGKNGEWNESVHMNRGLIEVNVGYLADKNVCWSCPNLSFFLFYRPFAWRAPHLYNYNMNMVLCCAAFSPHSHTTTACTRLLVSHPTPIPHLYFILCAVIFEQLFWYNFWDNLVVFSFYWLKTIEWEKERERIKT